MFTSGFKKVAVIVSCTLDDIDNDYKPENRKKKRIQKPESLTPAMVGSAGIKDDVYDRF